MFTSMADHETAIRLAARDTRDADALLRQAVGAARADGWTWDRIGQVLGITRQAAYQRFGKER